MACRVANPGGRVELARGQTIRIVAAELFDLVV